MTYVARHAEFATLDDALNAAHAYVCERHRGGRRLATRVLNAAGELIATVSLGRATAQEAQPARETKHAIKLFNRRYSK